MAAMAQDSVATVLVVDDDPAVRRILLLQLGQLGYHALEAGRGREALQILDKRPVDAVLLDVVMPDINGIDVLLHIKADERTEHIPVLVMTGLADQEMRLTALASGAEELLSKPVDRLELGSRLRNVLKVKALTDRLRHTSMPSPVASAPAVVTVTAHRPLAAEGPSDSLDSGSWRAAVRAAQRALPRTQPGTIAGPPLLSRVGLDGRIDSEQGPMLLCDFAADLLGRERLAAAVREAGLGNPVDAFLTLEHIGPAVVRVDPVFAGPALSGPHGAGASVVALVALIVPQRY